MKKLKKVVFVFVAVMFACTHLQARTMWKGFNFDVFSEAYQDRVPITACTVVTKTYNVSFNFGEATKGSLKSEETKEYDSHGYYIKNGNNTFENTYLTDGRISERKMRKNGQLKEVWRYEYMTDEKGPGFVCQKFNENGDIIGQIACQGKVMLFIDQVNGVTTKHTLNNQYYTKTMVIEISNMFQNVTITTRDQYNSSGFIDESTISGVGRQETTYYSNYIMGENGFWTSVTQSGYNACIVERELTLTSN